MQQGTKSPRTSPTFIPPELRKNVDDEANRLDRDLKARGINTIPHIEGQSFGAQTNPPANHQTMWQNTVPYVQAPQPQLDSMMPPGFDAQTAVNSFRTQPQTGNAEQLRYQQQLDQSYMAQPTVTAVQPTPVPPSIWNGYDLPQSAKIDLFSDAELDNPSSWNQEMQVQQTRNLQTRFEAAPAYHETAPVSHQAELDATHAAFVEQSTPEIKVPRTIADFLNLGDWVVYARAAELSMRQTETEQQ